MILQRFMDLPAINKILESGEITNYGIEIEERTSDFKLNMLLKY